MVLLSLGVSTILGTPCLRDPKRPPKGHLKIKNFNAYTFSQNKISQSKDVLKVRYNFSEV